MPRWPRCQLELCASHRAKKSARRHVMGAETSVSCASCSGSCKRCGSCKPLDSFDSCDDCNDCDACDACRTIDLEQSVSITESHMMSTMSRSGFADFTGRSSHWSNFESFFHPTNADFELDDNPVCPFAACLRSIEEELQFGAMRGDMRRVTSALAAGANINVVDARGATPLMLATASVGADDVDIVNMLLQRRATSTSTDKNGWTALHHACRSGKTEVARLLTKAKCDLAQITADGKSTILLAVYEGKIGMVKNLLKHEACRRQMVDRNKLSCTALHFASQTGHSEVVKVLIDANAKVNAKDGDGRMPLAWACEHGHLDVMRVLMSKTADPDAKDRYSRTPLFYAVFNQHEEAGLWLLKRGADPFIPDVYGDTPNDIAEDHSLAEFRKAMKSRRNAEELGIDEEDRGR